MNNCAIKRYFSKEWKLRMKTWFVDGASELLSLMKSSFTLPALRFRLSSARLLEQRNAVEVGGILTSLVSIDLGYDITTTTTNPECRYSCSPGPKLLGSLPAAGGLQSEPGEQRAAGAQSVARQAGLPQCGGNQRPDGQQKHFRSLHKLRVIRTRRGL